MGKISLTSPIVINVPIRVSLAVETKDLLFLWMAHLNNKSNVCKQLSSLFCRGSCYAVQAEKKPLFELLHASVSKRVLVHNHSNGNELRILMQIKLISLTIVEHQDSLRNRGKQQLGNGPLIDCIRHVRSIQRYVIKYAELGVRRLAI